MRYIRLYRIKLHQKSDSCKHCQNSPTDESVSRDDVRIRGGNMTLWFILLCPMKHSERYVSDKRPGQETDVDSGCSTES